MVKYSVGEAIEQAVQTEKLGAVYYASMAEKFRKNEGLKKLFTDLAAAEVKHEKTFAKLKRLVKDSGVEGWDEVSLYLRAIVESSFFLGKGKSLTGMGGIRKMADAVERALGFERETLFYYYGIRDGLSDTQIIDRVIAEEKKHILRLQKMKEELGK